ncbi:sensor domain-containing diguanylate cyclase [Thiomicrorhabdus lithotrophica]|uniref:diguanylate cyclase n=1 Tax=Thiomicrorhabdus lithotrophica TaxID=2949997 RepID=A0ABY8CBS8_9GAMM|nr:sensor domain-containing diguanylate cyclase [Thiomicrorhabdus lithotrophica]WEJ62657.1 sensor domain-containing diguanylate cyclase [Thiomicrorhabdus lithotrophica]
MNLDVTALPPFKDFESASRAVLTYLHEQLGFGLWMMTRTEGRDWIVLQVEDHYYNVKEGTVFTWTDSFCSQMVQGFGPRVAPCSREIPVYEAAPIGQQVPIEAYIGVPVNNSDGTLFGTLCAIDPNPQNPDITQQLPVIELLARFLGTVLESDLKALEQERLLERIKQEVLTDELTNVFNRRGWDKAVELEEERARRYGNPVCVMIIDLDGLKSINDNQGHAKGDERIQAAAKCISESVRENDIVARIGGDEFAVLAIECDKKGAEALYKKMSKVLCSNKISASIGKAMRGSEMNITQTMEQADLAMYAQKAQHKSMCDQQNVE